MKFVMPWLSAILLAACAAAPTLDTRDDVPTPAAISAPSGEYALDPTHASVTVRANHFGLSFYTLRFTGLDASLVFDADDPTRSSVRATVATSSVETDYPGARDFDAELRGADWLNAGAFPSASFQSRALELTGARTGRMTGDLTLNGVTAPVAFEVHFNHSYARHPFGHPVSQLGFSARGRIRRSQFAITHFLPEPGTLAGVGDEVELVIEAEFTRPIEG